jgi:hypothetical protein
MGPVEDWGNIDKLDHDPREGGRGAFFIASASDGGGPVIAAMAASADGSWRDPGNKSGGGKKSDRALAGSAGWRGLGVFRANLTYAALAAGRSPACANTPRRPRASAAREAMVASSDCQARSCASIAAARCLKCSKTTSSNSG